MATQPLNIQEFIDRIDELIQILPSRTLDIMESVMLVAKSEVNTRIVEKGEGADGSPLPEYTPEYLQFKQDVGRYRGVVDLQLGNYSINKRIDAVEARKKARGRQSKNKAQRTEAGAQRRIKAIPTGGTLWPSIQLVAKENKSGELFVSIAPIDDTNRKKAEGLSKKRGDFLALSAREQENLQRNFDEQFAILVNGIFEK